MAIYLRAAVLGLATGGRSTIGITALAFTGSGARSRTAGRWIAGATGLASAVELTGDKLPQAPSRLAPPGLSARLAGGVAAGVLLARRDGATGAAVPLAGLIGLAGAVAGALVGMRWRSLAVRRLGVDWPGAVAEDIACLAAAGYVVTAR
jgi:uncharacterized membrane protein